MLVACTTIAYHRSRVHADAYNRSLVREVVVENSKVVVGLLCCVWRGVCMKRLQCAVRRRKKDFFFNAIKFISITHMSFLLPYTPHFCLVLMGLKLPIFRIKINFYIFPFCTTTTRINSIKINYF